MPRILTTSSGSAGGAGVNTLNALSGDVIIAAGTNITVSDDGVDTITIDATGGGGITSINGDSTATQTLTVGTSGNDFAIVDDAAGDHTFNLPSASATARGVITTGSQTIAGTKTLSSAPILSALTASQAVVTDGSKVLASLAYTNTNTASALVQRDGSGNFSAGTITASLTGVASGNTTYTANDHGIVVSGSGNAMTVITPDASATKVLKSGGASANPSWLAYDNANTVSTLVFRDGSGNFSAGTITAALTGAASSNVLKTGDTMTGPLNMPAGSASTAELTGGTANTGLFFPTSATAAFTSGGTEIWRTGANGITIGNTTAQTKALYIKPSVSSTGIQIENANNTRKFDIDVSSANFTAMGVSGTNGCVIMANVATGGTGVNWISISANTPEASPPYPQGFNCASGDGNITALSSIVPFNGNVVNGAPWLVMGNRNSTVNTLCGYVTVGSSRNPMSFAGTVHKTQTAASEVSDYIVSTQKAGTLTEAVRITDQGQLKIQEAGAGLSVKEGSNCKMGVSTLVGGTVTVSTTAVTASSRIFVTANSTSTGHGSLWVDTITAATSFKINSTNVLDDAVVAWMIVEPS